ncbi:MAG TPA: hypothetical protein VGK58_09085, partial [Lacipirellulaceae bacterium]
MFRLKLNTRRVVLRVAMLSICVTTILGTAGQLLAVGLNYVESDDFTNLTPTSAIDSFGSMAGADNL